MSNTETANNPKGRRKQALSSDASWKWDAAFLPLGLGFLYVVGYVLVNLHPGRQLLGSSVLSTRYLSAAISFVVFHAVPISFGMYAARLVIALEERPKWNMQPGKMLGAFIVVFVVGYIMWYIGIQYALTEWHWFNTAFIYLLAFALGTFAAWGFALHRQPKSLGVTGIEAQVGLTSVFAIFLVLLPLFYGRLLFPDVKAFFGGGSPTLVRLVAGYDSSFATLRSALRRPALLIDRDEQTTVLIVCLDAPDSLYSRVRSIAFPSAKLGAIEVLGSMSWEHYASGDYPGGCPRPEVPKPLEVPDSNRSMPSETDGSMPDTAP